MVILIALGLIVLGVVLYFVLRPTPPMTTTIKNGPYDLSKKENAVKVSDFSNESVANAFVNDGEGTFQCFVILDALARTGGHVECGVGSNKPDCGTGLYNVCTCSAVGDCTNCNHEGYQPVFTIHGIYTLEIMNTPDASRPNGVASQLTVRTKTDRAGTPITQVETINLPPITHQKWVMITIAREGRRLDIYYNNTLVSSNKLNNIVSTISNGTPLVIGNYMLSGKIGALSFFPNRYSINDVSSTYAKVTNTRGDPLMFTTTSTSHSYSVNSKQPATILSSLCLDGSCLSFPKVGQPEVSSYPNIFNIKTSVSGVPFTTQYA
jgi:hypothetical protein